MLDMILFLVALAGTAVVFADVLVREGMLLAPVQRWVRVAHQWLWKKYHGYGPQLDQCLVEARYYDGHDLDSRWWWKPLWGCSTCVAGQWGFWGYLLRYHEGYTQGWVTALFSTLPEHIAFTAFTIITAIIISKWTRE